MRPNLDNISLLIHVYTLRAVQEANALKALPRPKEAKDQVLYNAVEKGSLEDLRRGLLSGYSPNHEAELHPKFGTSPLMAAAFHGHVDKVRLLIEHNALLNVQSGYGWTALHYAGQAKQVECAALLVAAGADRQIQNKKGIHKMFI